MAVISVSGKQAHQQLYPGAYNYVDVSSLSRELEFYADVECCVLQGGVEALALNVAGEANKHVALNANSAGGGTAIAGTALDFSLSSATMEIWASAEVSVSSFQTVVMLGNSSSQVEFRPQLDIDPNTKEITSRIRIRTSAGASTLVDLSDGVYNCWQLVGGMSTRPIHFVHVLERTAGNSCTYKLYVNTTLVVNYNNASATAAAAQPINMSGGTGGAGIYIGALNGISPHGGRIWAVRCYPVGLSNAQVVTRNRLGPNILPTDSATPSWVLDFSKRKTWTDGNVPQATDISGSVVTTLTTQGSAFNARSDIVAAGAGGQFPSPEVGGRGVVIPADTATRIRVSGATLVVQNLATAAGTLRLSEVLE